MTPQKKIEAADKASDIIIEGWNAAFNELSGPLFTNGHGIIADPSLVMERIRRAREALYKATMAYEQTVWPNRSDYEAVDG